VILYQTKKNRLEPKHNHLKPKANPRSKTTKTFARFAGLGTTLAAAIGLGAFGGRQIDDYYQLEKPLGTAIGALLGLTIGMWSVLRNIKTK
jgi:F0F1-type ATP synthase assembly protein I